tara:strand:+ start:631 stop:1320 length:690 start_codon:yes stop_codon:yes gene_type:complete
MKVGFTGINFQEGKIKYNDDCLIALEKKDNPKKTSPFFVEFLCDEFIHTEAIVIPKDKILDLLILDMEKIENRMSSDIDENQKILLKKCLIMLDEETPLCNIKWEPKELEILNELAPHSIKPIIQINGDEDMNTIIKMILKKANYMFFYTSGDKESHAWLVKNNTSIKTCAGKIHSDLEKGFIRGDVVNFNDYMNHHNFNDCKKKGLAKTVEKDYIVQPNEIIEIRFNV